MKPQAAEYAPYYGKYIELVPDGDLATTLEREAGETKALLTLQGEERGDLRYAPDKWSVKEVLGHVIDTERVFAYRLMWVARGDTTPLPSMNQEEFMRDAPFAGRSLASLLEEFDAVRRATILLLRGLSPEALQRRGVASGYEVSAKAIAYMIAGHEIHHRNVLRDKYFA